jgi:DNA-binding transcriptional LysR family regulator
MLFTGSDSSQPTPVGIGPVPCILGDAEAQFVRLLDAPKNVWASVWLLTHKGLRPAGRVRVVLDALAQGLRGERSRIEGDASPE